MNALKDVFNNISSIPALMGETMTGGGTRRKHRKGKSGRKKSRMSKPSKSVFGMRVPKKYRMGFFGGDQKYFVCNEFSLPSSQAPGAPAAPTSSSGMNVPNSGQAMMKASDDKIAGMSGGASMKILAYKRMLSRLSVEKLQKMAVKRGVKITKKKDGKTVYVKKATLVRKLCECKMGRKMRRSKSSRNRSKRYY